MIKKSPLRLLIATRNPGKLKEFKQFLSGLPLQLLSLRDFPGFTETEEPYQTFAENARHKAISALRATGLISLGDDSGLEVDALKGAPGIFSARFAGQGAGDEKNNQKLLELLKDTPAEKRTARFVCVLALALSESEVRLVEGEARGLILFEPRGEKGFGYDPVFYDPRLDQTFAELEAEEKLKVSHRGDALGKLRPMVEELARTRTGTG